MFTLSVEQLGPDGETLRSFDTLTTAGNATLEGLHGPMPVLLEEEHWPVWSGERAGDAIGLMQPADNGCCISGQ